MRYPLSIAILSTLMACASGGTSAANSDAARPTDGTYEFVANTPNQLIRGSIRVDSEGAGIQYETTCQPEASIRALPRVGPSVTTTSMRYYCSGAWLTFDKRNPASAMWFATVEAPRRREVCSRYETQNGRQVCASRTTETYYVAEQRSGGIQVRRVP
jgi:hypothetical protein